MDIFDFKVGDTVFYSKHLMFGNENGDIHRKLFRIIKLMEEIRATKVVSLATGREYYFDLRNITLSEQRQEKFEDNFWEVE